jgi:hypothetical protein
MITRYLSMGLAAALVAFGVYHWFLVTGLKHEVRTRDEKISQQTQRIQFLEADNAGLTKINADFKLKTDEQNTAVEALRQEQETVKKRAAVALAAAERKARQFEARATTISMAAAAVPDNACESVEMKLTAYIEERLREMQGEAGK